MMGKRVLIADDNEFVRVVIRTYVEQQIGVEVCGEAANGTEAVESAKKLKPDLVLLDLMMPELNGIQAASILKAEMPEVRIILFTLYSDHVGETLASAAGVDMVLSKPDGMSVLPDAVNSLLARAPTSRSQSEDGG